MANRRFGGNQRGGGRSFQQANLNPWQGGVTPGNSLDNNIQAQLALALTNLLQPQQQNNPPSLLSLNTSPGFMNQDSNYNSPSRFGSRGRSDFRRSELYNSKNRGGSWRNDRRGGNFSSPRSNSRSFKDRKSDTEKLNKSDSAKTSEKLSKSLDDSKSNAETEIIDISMEESRDEDGNETEKKREWLKEKNSSDEKDDSKTDENEKEAPSEEGIKKERKDNSKFAGLPSGFLHCFVCDKSMWDGESFQNHIRGKAHKQMLNSLEDSFQIIVNILRENMRLTEEKKMIELNRIQRNNRKFVHKYSEPESHCNMCDLKFLGKIISHRKTEGHQRLKRFLHPNCDTCNLEFPSRMEWVDHRFTPEHLHKLKEVLEAKSAPEDGYKIVDDTAEFDIEPMLQENMQTEDENPVLELTDDLANLQNRIPAYLKTRIVSKGSLKPAEGFVCDICNRFFDNEATAEEHLKTEGHYHEFITAVKNKYKRTANEKAEGDDESNRKRKKLDNENEDAENNKDVSANADEGNAIYDPEEACKEEENNEDENEIINKNESKSDCNEELWLEHAFPLDGQEVNEDQLLADDKPETTEEASVPSVPEIEPKVTRKRAGNVRNGAGPKSKTRGKK